MKHNFAVYYADIDALSHSAKLTDKDLIRRLLKVLRLEEDEQVILFNRTYHAMVTIGVSDNKSLSVIVDSLIPNESYTPAITMLLPILKRDDFDTAIYNLVQAGVSYIQPVITAQAQRSWGGPKEQARVERLIIAAAEQSKNFMYPLVGEPLPLERVIAKLKGVSLFADPEGQSFFTVMQKVRDNKPTTLNLLIGPEADLSSDEKQMIAAQGFISCKLTPTILRAAEAAFLVTAAVRSSF
jgi:RNA methyltransferase, RsmE family